MVDELVVSHRELKPGVLTMSLQRNVEGVVATMPEHVVDFSVAAVVDFVKQFHGFSVSGGMLFRVW